MKALKIITAVFSMIKGGISLVEKLMTGSARRKERERKAKRRKIFWTLFLGAVGVTLAVLFFPYKLVVKRNGDFEIRTLLVRLYRKTADYNIPEGGNDGFEIASADEHTAKAKKA